MDTPPFRRRRIVVDRPFQWSLCLHGVKLGLAVLVAVTFGMFAPLLWQLDGARSQAAVDGELAIVMVYLHERFWIVAGGCLVLVGFAAMRLSHRIAGPLVRYKRNLRLLAEGKLPSPLRTRRRDYLKEEVVCLNAAVDGVRQRVEAIRAATVVLRRELAAAVDGEPRLAVRLQGALEAQRQLEQRVAGFRETGELDAVPAGVPARGTVFAFAGRSEAGGPP